MTTKTRFTKALGLTAALFLLGACDQADEQKAPSDKTSEAGKKVSPIDHSNPTEVAEAFITAIAAKDYQKAVEYIAPDQREELAKALEGAMPPLPAQPDIRVRVKENGIQADVAVVNAAEPSSGPPFGLDLSLIDGKWWVVK